MRLHGMGDTAIRATHSQDLAKTKRQGALATRLRRYFAIVLVFVALCAGAWIERELLLRGSADLWIVSDPITPADAVVVLGGGIDVRPFVAADLYAKGLVKKVLLSQVEDGPSIGIGALTRHTEDNRKVLLRLGVPEAAIETFGNANKNTREEAVALKDWAERNRPSVLIIPTDVFAARRVRWTFRRELGGTAVRIEVPSFDPPKDYSRADWWKTAPGVIAFQNEVLKYFYYRLKY
jgi:uncharacterized SAM-binding protein YcdF (DUF218 family)